MISEKWTVNLVLNSKLWTWTSLCEVNFELLLLWTCTILTDTVRKLTDQWLRLHLNCFTSLYTFKYVHSCHLSLFCLHTCFIFHKPWAHFVEFHSRQKAQFLLYMGVLDKNCWSENVGLLKLMLRVSWSQLCQQRWDEVKLRVEGLQ